MQSRYDTPPGLHAAPLIFNNMKNIIKPARLPLTVCLLLATLLASGKVSHATAQTAAEVLNAAVQHHQSQIRQIRDFTVVQAVMGTEGVSYFEREEVDGQSVLVPKSVTVNGMAVPSPPGAAWSDLYANFPDFEDRARIEGRETVDGEATYLIVVDDFEGLDMTPPGSAQQGGEFVPTRMTMAIDADEHIIHRVVMEGEMAASGRTMPMTTTMHMRDYRNTDGLLYPWSTTVVTEGLSFGGDRSPERQEEMRQRLEQLEQQLESMPPEQRKMMGDMVAGPMQQLRQMLETGTIEMTLQIKEIRVNQGPPDSERP